MRYTQEDYDRAVRNYIIKNCKNRTDRNGSLHFAAPWQSKQTEMQVSWKNHAYKDISSDESGSFASFAERVGYKSLKDFMSAWGTSGSEQSAAIPEQAKKVQSIAKTEKKSISYFLMRSQIEDYGHDRIKAHLRSRNIPEAADQVFEISIYGGAETRWYPGIYSVDAENIQYVHESLRGWLTHNMAAYGVDNVLLYPMYDHDGALRNFAADFGDPNAKYQFPYGHSRIANDIPLHYGDESLYLEHEHVIVCEGAMDTWVVRNMVGNGRVAVVGALDAGMMGHVGMVEWLKNRKKVTVIYDLDENQRGQKNAIKLLDGLASHGVDAQAFGWDDFAARLNIDLDELNEQGKPKIKDIGDVVKSQPWEKIKVALRETISSNEEEYRSAA